MAALATGKIKGIRALSLRERVAKGQVRVLIHRPHNDRLTRQATQTLGAYR